METIDTILDFLRREGRLTELAVSPSGFVFDPRSGQSYTLNPTGVFFLTQLRDGGDAATAASAAAEQFGVSCALTRGAVEGFVRQLKRVLA
ncbi:PqqD family peptide modification chaperone [Thiorhodovibrio frisius]|uniref:PqqD family protein n=1 Tax=Thiorhodovibrio frisius TaxID=631362 RepID=H8Z7U3_9GAMM|nr:PqqD family peptide modification chaperone [Thiorhodovibrio frisius]EIC20955.1 hypothetical protein Thi970DRAFT_04635 [Thiorhodovibrio frisius]WPL22014.1 hypothetical protein Thiofri_02161 [Thiorhodovibrio frisius]